MKGLAARKIYGVLVILAGLVTLITCGKDDWTVTGLGSHVDTSPPVVQILTDFGTGPGSFLTGKKRIYIDATDDIAVNSVTVIYTYNYMKDGKIYPMEVAVDAFWSDAENCYAIDIDTLNGFWDEGTQTWLPMVDGPLSAIVMVEDKSGRRTTTPDIIYTVKNGPPKVTMQIPKPRTRNSDLLNEDPYPIVVSDSYFLGVYEDLAGLAPGYPLIKFWEAGKPEPVNYRENAGWENVSGYNSPGDGWIRPDEGVSENERGEKGGSIRYFLRKRQPNGKAFGEDTKNGLPAEKRYNLKIKAVDINGITLEWPHDVYPNKPGYMTMYMDAEGVPPIVTIIEPDQAKLYFRDDFNIIAEAEHQGDLSTEISELRFEVIGKDRNTVLLQRWVYPDIKDKSQGKFKIELEKTYYSEKHSETIQIAKKVDKESDVPGSAFSYVTFTDGNFTFNITAYDDIGARKTVPFSIYIDKQPPVTTVTSVSPYYSQDATTSADKSNGFETKPYRRWTVNKTIDIAVSSTDNRGDAIDPVTNHAKFKYLLSSGNDIQGSAYYAWKGSDQTKTFEQYLYEASGARYFDAVKANPVQITSGVDNGNPLERVEGKDGSYTLRLQTHKFNTAVSYNLWLYIVAMDNAENISFDKILLNVDQDTDKPKITFTDMNTFMNDKSFIGLAVEDDNGMSDEGRKDIPQVFYRFAKNDAEKNSLTANPNNGWHPVYDWSKSWDGILSLDVKRVTINDLTLKTIAKDLGLNENDDLKTVLGTEEDPKYLQIRAVDNVKTKLYSTDGLADDTTEWKKFTMDLTIPVVRVSQIDLDNKTLQDRTNENPFGIPEKNRAYNNMQVLYGDIIEENLSSIIVKIDGDNAKTITYTILDSPDASKDLTRYSVIYPGKPAIDPVNFYVWKNNDAEKSKRWYIPTSGIPGFNALEDGPHTFEITFEDKVPQIVSRSLTFYKDTKGPAISFVTPGGTDTIDPSLLTSFNNALNNGTSSSFPALLAVYNKLTDKSIKDMSTELSGTFTDDYSPIAGADFHSFWWSIDGGAERMGNLDISEDKAVSWKVPLTKYNGDELDDGVHTLSIRVNDSLGNGSEKNNLAFLIDKSVPELAITKAPEIPINNSFTFEGEITKTNKVKQLSVKLGNDEIATIDENGAVKYPIVNGKTHGVKITIGANLGKLFKFTAEIDPRGLEDGPKSLMFSAVGSSGQSGMTTSSFTLDTKGPSIAIGAPLNDSVYAASNTEWSNLKEAVDKDDFSLFGGVPNGAGSTYDKVFKARIKDGKPTFTVTFTDAASSVFEEGNNAYWYKFDDGLWASGSSTNYGKTSVSVDLALPSEFQKDGIHRLSIRAKDSLGNGYSSANDISGDLVTGSGVGYQSNLLFMIDTGVPELVVKNDKDKTVPSAEAADFGIHNSSFTIKGEITGTFDVQDLSVKIGSTVVAQRANSGATINNMTFTPKPNGKRTYNFSGVIINPFDSLLGGSVSDGSKDGSYTVSVSVKGSSEQSVMNVSTFTLDTQGPKITINAPIKENIYMDNDQRSLIINAISNNDISSLASKPFDTTGKTLKDKYYDLLRYNVKDKSSGLSGSFADTYSDVGDQYWYSFDGGASWETGYTKFPNTSNKKSAEWEIEIPSTLQEGMNRLSIRVKDTLTNGYDKNSAGVPDKGGNGYETNLNFILDTLPPVLQTVTGLNEGNDPSVKGPSDEIKVSGQITGTFMVKRLSVSVVSGSTVILTSDGNQAMPVYGDPYIYDFELNPVANKSKTFDYSFKVKTKHLTTELLYGSRSITVNALGSSDQSDLKTLSFIYDNEGPTVNVSVPSKKLYMSGSEVASLNTALDDTGNLTPVQQTQYNTLDSMIITDASAKLSGTFNDEYSPIGDTFWWQIDNSGVWQSVPITGSSNKSVGWEVPLDSSLEEGVHLLSLRVKDALGNGYADGSTPLGDGGQGFETNLAFLIDKSAPEITEIIMPSAALKKEFTVNGIIAKTFGVKKLSVKLGNDEIAVLEKNSGGNYVLTKKPVLGVNYGVNITVDRRPNAKRSFDFTATINPISKKTGGGLDDGPIPLTFTAVGSSGQAAIGVDSFTLDTTGPKVTVGAPISASVYVGDTEWASLEPAVRTDYFSAVPAAGSTYDKLFEARIKDNKASFTVTFTDDASNIFSAENNKYWYRFDGEGWQDAEVDSAEFGKKSVSVKLPLPAAKEWTDSVHRLSIRVKDSLDNGYDKNTSDSVISALVGEKQNNDYGHETYRTFMIDSGNPKLENISTELGTINSKGSLSISGKITNTFRVEDLNAKIGSSTKNIDLKSYFTRADNSMKTYNITNALISTSEIYDATKNVEGSYTVSLTVQGSSDLSDTKVSTFILDTKGPAISVNAPIKDRIYLTDTDVATINGYITNNNGLPTGIESTFYTMLKNNVKDKAAGLSGSFSDTYSDIGETYWYKFNDGGWRTVDLGVTNKKSVDWQIPLTEANEGVNRLSIRVKDKLSNGYGIDPSDDSAINSFTSNTNPNPKYGDNGYETNISFILDTSTPEFDTVLGDIKEGNEPTVMGPSSSVASVSGQISGTYLVKRLSVSIGSGADVIFTNDAGVPQTPVNGDPYINTLTLTRVNGTTFNYTFNVDVTSGTPLAYGSRTITINAIGSSDNSAVKTLSFIYDNKGPNVSVSVPSKKLYMEDGIKNALNSALLSNNLDATQKALYDSLKPMLITDSSTQLSGTFNDEYSAVADKNTNNNFWWQIDGGDWETGTLAVSDEKSVSWAVPISTLGDGVHLLNLRAKDKWGNGNGSGGTDPDKGGYENNIAFMIDRSVPELKMTKEPKIPINDAFTFEGKITNTYGVKRLSVKYGVMEIASIEEGQAGTGGITLDKTQDVGRSFDFKFNIDPKTLSSDGPISLVFNAIGSSGQVAMVTSSFTYDVKGPKITIGAPLSESFYITDAQWSDLEPRVKNDSFTGISSDVNTIFEDVFRTRIKDNTASFTVTFSDDYSSVFTDQEKFFWYKLDNASKWTPVEADTNDRNKQSVSIKLSLLGINEKWTDGVHRLSIRATDSLGNGFNDDLSKNPDKETGSAEGYQSNLIFMIDSGLPELSVKIDDPVSGIINKSQSLIISGTIINTFSVQELSVKIGSTFVADITDKIVITDKKTKYNFNNVYIGSSVISEATKDKEGSYTISVTVKGSSDQSGMIVNTFVLDTEGPKISINSPIKEKIYLTTGQIDDINAAITANNIDSLASKPFGTTGTTLKAKYYDLLKYNVKDISAGLSGSFADTYSNIGVKYWYKFNDGDWAEGNTSFTNPDNNKSADWQIKLTPQPDGTVLLPNNETLENGLNRLSIRVQDELSNGYYKDTSPGGDSGNGFENNITFILDTKTPELNISFKDNAVKGPTTENYFTVSGQISETFMVKRLSVSLKGPLATVIEPPADGSAPIPVENDENIKNIKLTPAANKGKAFDFSFDVYTTLEYGPHSITVNTIGSSEQSAIRILPFIFDNQGPNITVNTPITQKVYLSKNELDILNANTNLPGTALTDKYEKLLDMGIKDASSGLNGYFNDEYSTVAGTANKTFWYKFLDDESASWEPVEITNTKDKSVAWTIPLTDPKTPGTAQSPIYRKDGIYRVSIRVKDSLGNGYDDKTPDSEITDNSGPGYETELAFIIDMGIPEITNFRLKKKDGTLLPDTNIFVNDDFIITGTILKTAKIAKLTAKIGSNVITAAESNITKVTDKEFTFEIPVSPKTLGLEQKAHSLSITATGSSGQSAIEVSNFTYDITAPIVSFNSPVVGKVIDGGKLSNGEYSIVWSGSWETGEIKVGGVADDTFGVDKIFYHIGKLNDNAGTDASREALYSNPLDWKDTALDTNSPAPKWSGGLYYWNYVEDFNTYRYSPALFEKSIGVDNGDTDNTFYLPFYVKVVDRAGNINVVHYKLFVDPDKDIPSTKIVSPADGVRVGGEIRITGTANDNNWVHSVDIRIIDTKKDPGTPGYYYRNPGDKWVDDNTGYEVADGTGTTSGFVKAKIVGNTDLVVSWYYSINADNKLTPDIGMDERPVIVEVRAWDTKVVEHDIPDLKNKIYSMVNYIFDSGVPTISVPIISKTGSEDRKYSDGIRVSGTYKVTAEVQDNGGIDSIRARLTGKADFKEIVKDGKKTSVSPTDLGLLSWNVIEPTTYPQNQWEKGWRYYIIDLGSGVNWNAIDLDSIPGKTYIKGTSIKYNGTAITGSGATAMRADGNRANISPDDDKSNSANWNSQFFKYTVELTIDSTKNFAYGKTGIFTVELDVTDNNKEPAPYNTRGTFNMGVDNFYPSTEIATQYNATTETFRVMGTAKDYDEQSGGQQGLERVLVYFSRVVNGATEYYNARGIKAGTADARYNGKGYKDDLGNDWSGGISMVTNPNVMDMTKTVTGYEPNGAMANFPYIKYVGDTWQSPHAMVIDSQEISDDVDSDGDGTYGEMWPERVAVKAWQARLDTTVLTDTIGDGPLTVHYIVMDEAGNATHYAKNIYVGNNKPLIRDINLGTDINASGGLTADEYSDAITIGPALAGNKEIQTNFRVRNDRLGLKLFANFGNGIKNYRISHVTRDGTELAATSMVRGTVYTIATPGDTEWTKYGALFNNAGITFVATGPAESSKTPGTVYTYTYTGTAAEKKGTFTNDNAEDVFTSFTSMQDTPAPTKQYGPDGKMILLHDKHFIVKVYDSTVKNEGEEEQLSHVALLNMDFDNDDGQKPLVSFKPFYWNSLTDNSVYESNLISSALTDVKKREALQGHIELEGDLPDTFNQTTGINDRDPKVSGKVSFRGTAYDNIVINNIYFEIDKHNTTDGYGVTGVTNVVAGKTYYPVATFSGGKLTGNNNLFTNKGWKFTVVKETLDQDGHYVEWQLDYDSSFVTNVANSDVTLAVIARDTKPATPNVSVRQEKRFDVVPYITKITTRLSAAYKPNPSAFDRSAQGWYPVHEDEVITIDGFNLYTKTGNPSVDIRQTSNATTQGSTLYTNGVGSHNVNKIFARVDNDQNDNNANSIVSGYLVVQVNSIDSLNNINNNTTAEYNKEGNGLNNDTLNDDRALYVWNTGYISNEDVGHVSHPFMRMDNNGGRLLSYGYYNGNSTGRLKVLRNNDLIDAGLARSNRIFNTTIATGGTNNSWYASGSDQSSDTNRGFLFGLSNATGEYNGVNGSTSIANNATTGYISIVTGMENSRSNRFKIPRIAVQPTNGTNNRDDNHVDRIFMSYFDGETNELRVIYGNVGQDASATSHISNISNISSSSPQTVATDNTNYKGSMYTAAGLLQNGLPVIAWYDRESQELVFSYGSGVPTSTVINNANAIVTTPTTAATGTSYTATAAHNFATGNRILAGTTNPPRNGAGNTTAYFITGVNGNSFSLNTTAGGTGQDIGAGPIYAIKAAGPAIDYYSGATVDGAGGSVNNTIQYWFQYNHGFSRGDQVRIFTNGNDRGVYYVRDGNTGSTGSLGVAGPNYAVTPLKFSIAANSSTTGDFFNETANISSMYVYSTTVYTANRSAAGSSASWQGNATVIDEFKGTHVDMAVDGNSNVHLAYYDVSNGGLYYALIPYNSVTGRPDSGAVQKVRVDTYLSAGIKIMINVRLQDGNYVPYISYGHGSFGETRNSVRVAWRHNFSTPATVPAGSDESDKFTSDWEVMTVPVTANVTPVADEFVCNGVPAGTINKWTAPGGTSTLRTYSGGINKTILLGYMTDKWYEGAILKKDLY